MNKTELKKIWNEMKLSCLNSYSVQHIKVFYEKVGLEFPEKLIYTKKRYREMAQDIPRVDAQDVLIDVCDKLEINPDEGRLNLANKMFGEGSRRQYIEEAYLEFGT